MNFQHDSEIVERFLQRASTLGEAGNEHTDHLAKHGRSQAVVRGRGADEISESTAK